MSATKNFRAVARTIGMGLPLLALLTTSCSRDPLAPDCFVVENGQCLIPSFGEDVTGSCEEMPDGAVGAYYEFDLKNVATGGTGNFINWMVDGLPAGLAVDEDGVISGVPTDPGTSAMLAVSVEDAVTGQIFTFECGTIGINERLSALGIRTEADHCLDYNISKDEMLAKLTGGTDPGLAPIICLPIADTDNCGPHGDGNGRLPPGITFDAETCTHTGSVSSDIRGTWVWMVGIQQSPEPGEEDQPTTYVPFCARNDVDTFHDIGVTAFGGGQSELIPGLLEYDPDSAPVFGQGDYVWDVSDPDCNANPGNCNNYGFKFDVTCSPFDPPFNLTHNSTGLGLAHDLTAMGPVPSDNFRHRPWVGSFEFSYCTSPNMSDCDVMGGFDQNAQTSYLYSVIGYPVE